LAFGRRQAFGGQAGWCLRERGVDAEDMRGEPAAEDGGDHASPVAAVGCEPFVAEPPHEFHPGGRDLSGPPPGGGRLVAVTEARQRRGHDVERWRVDILRIRQFIYYVDEFGDAARPAVGQEQRCGIRAR
jgi:hypothetical protein